MAAIQQSSGKIRISFRHALSLLGPYVQKRLMEQIRAVSVITLCLVLFQTLVLRIPIAQASVISLGIGLVILGLMFFMEGLFLGIMPLGEQIGVVMPRKSKLPVIIIFSFLLGMGATYAEPAIGILKAAGFAVKPWDAPLLFVLLNKASGILVVSVGVGVGVAVIFGMLRFMYSWSLKPLLYTMTISLLGLTIAVSFNANLRYLVGVAWDCGGVTTGPVTVPLVLALGIGICRVVGSATSGAAGFGVVSLASLFPILMVSVLGLGYVGSVPRPMDETSFFSATNRAKAVAVFVNRDDMIGYALRNASPQSQLALFDNDQGKMLEYVRSLSADPAKAAAVFGLVPGALQAWALGKATPDQRLAVFGSEEAARAAALQSSSTPKKLDLMDIFSRNSLSALQAVIPLSLFLVLVLTLLLREKLPRPDEAVLGVILGLVGMSLFNCGNELGLAKIGAQVGDRLPSSFKAIELTEARQEISNFDMSVVQTAVAPDGTPTKFFFVKSGDRYTPLPFHQERLDPALGRYAHVPVWGPLFGKAMGFWGILVVLLFAFVIGYGATIAEPALNAMGTTVEELTVGTFKKDILIQAVAVGVGVGIVFGVARLVWDFPLWYILAPPYVVTLILTIFSSEEFTNIAWDSGGVTTGPITVPLVLAMGLGVGGQLGIVEGFGILAMASVWPIMLVLLMGVLVNRSRRDAEVDAAGAAA